MIRISTLAAAALLAASASTAAAQQDFRWAGRIAPGDRIAISNLGGEVRADLAPGDEVVVTAIRRGRDAGLVRIETVRRNDGMAICAIYPSRGDDGRRARRSDDDGNDGCSQQGNVRTTDAEVDFVVHVPANVRLAASTISGNVIATGLRSEVHAATVSGNVRVTSDGPVHASSVSGEVYARVGRNGARGLHFDTVSGDIVVELDGNVSADLDANTLSGHITADFPLETGERGRRQEHDGVVVNVQVGQHARGPINGGGEDLKLNSVSGDITVRRAR